MCSITTNLPNSDIEVEVEYEIRGRDNVVYSAAYIGGAELLADHLIFIDRLGNTVSLADYFNFKLQDVASSLLEVA